MSIRRLTPRLLLLLLPILLLMPMRSADARLEGREWREVQAEFKRLFQGPGEPEAKAEVIAKLLEDGESRAWKMLIDALAAEAKFWIEREALVNEKVDAISVILRTPSAKRYPKDEDNLREWQADLVALEANAKEELGILESLGRIVAEGPEALRKALFSRARGPVKWPVRAAAARVAAARPGETLSFEFLQRAVTGDKDPRVRMAGLDALRGFEIDEETSTATTLDTVESLILGRLADEDWGVQLMALRIIQERKMRDSIPHLINALEHASPRLSLEVGDLLKELTGENHDPFADVWAKWWEEHKEEYGSSERVRGGDNARRAPDVTFYGLPLESDRIIFIIDISSSMLKETQNVNPAGDAPQPEGPVTPQGDGAPPPPPPEEILSGPKIDVAKTELKKAIKKLPRTAQFNLIAFNHAVLQWRDEMVEATDANKKEAYKWIRSLDASGSTYIDGALRLAFRVAGLGAVDRAYKEVNVDTIVLLSDGAPTDNGFPVSEPMETEVLLEHVRGWNAQRRIIVHTIGVDMVEGIEFLQRLAAENGGTYVDR
ncbi:MAG: VWA domain-containing protein [Planctomycetota bacterium]|jgi:HEAT repeat protein